MAHDPQALWQQWQAWQAGQTTVGKVDPETGGLGRLIETVRQQAPPPVAQPQPTMTWVQPRSGALSPEVAAQFAPPTWQAPGQPPPAGRPTFLPPEEGKPEWAQEPVPETWGEYPKWWLGRQAGHVAAWWEEAQEEIWGEPEEQLEPGEAITQQWAQAWEPGIEAAGRFREEPSWKALGGTLLGAARGLAGGLVGAPIAGLKAAPGVTGKLFTALDQAARGVTGALAGGFEIFDTGLVEQGILGAGAELLYPTMQGHEADFTPQEFEAGRNRYTRWWTSVSTYSKELWNARMKGVDWDTALDRASTKAGAATEELRELTLEAIRNGATREDIEANATLTSPLAELAGRVLLDPLNLLAKPGHAARMRGQESTAAKALNFEDAGHYDEIIDLMKAEGANNAAGGFKGPIYKILHPNRADNATLAGRWAEDSTLVLSQMLGRADDPGEVSKIIRSMISIGEEGTDAARAAQVHLKKFGRIAESSAGKKTTLLLREMATDAETGKLSLKVVGSWFEGAKSDKDILKRVFASYDGAVARVYPTGKISPVRRAQNKYRKFLSQYMYMGWNPGYAFRNGASNASLTAISGWNPFESADRINDYVNRWGGDVFGLRTGYGGPGGEYLMEQVSSALDAIDSTFDAVRFKDLPTSVIEDLAQKGIKGAPAMRLSETVETASGQRIMHQALDYFWGKHWRPKLPDELASLFDRRALRAYEDILADCVNPVELENALDPALKGRIIPEGIDLRGLPTDLRNDIRLAMLEAEDAEDFTRRMQDLSSRADEFLTKTLDETAIEISKGDTLVYPVTQADRKAIEAVEDSELGKRLHGLQDEFEAQLGKDRARDLADAKMLGEYHHRAPPEAKNQIMDLVLAHREDGVQVANRVDDARRKAWQASDATKRGVAGRVERDTIWNDYFTFRNDEWRKYWDEFDQQATEFLGRRLPPVAPTAPMPEAAPAVEGVAAPPEAGVVPPTVSPPSALDAPDFLTARNELAEEMLADIVPPRQAIAHISTKQAKQTLEDLANAAPGINWAAPEGLSPEDYERVMDWIKSEITPQMHEAKLLANKVALNERDFILFNYSDRRHFDNALAYIFPYHYWYTRAATNVPGMLAYKPGMLSAYLDYKDAVHQINQEAQGLPWWSEQVKIPGTQFYMNLEATLNPLYSMINDFHNPGRTQTWQGEMLENLGNIGPSVDTAFWALYGAWRASEGEPEEALASMGYLGQPTKAFRYATGLLGAKGGKGITLEPWLWDDPFSFTGMDYYERNRMGYHFKQMEDEGAVTPEVIWDEGYKQAGPAWDEAVARQVQERAVPMLTSWLMGVGFKPRLPYEIQVQKALNAQYQFYSHADKTYDMDTEEGQAAYRAAQKQLYEYYPFLSYTMLVKRGEQDRDKAYAWEVLNRLPPGKNKYVILESANTSEEALSKFYETGGSFEGWSEVDRSHFMASIQSLGHVLAIPDKERQKEWDSAQTLKRALNVDLQSRFGDDIFDIQATYYDVRDVAGADAAKAVLDANPKLGEMWTARNAAIVASPALMSYWGSLDTLDRVAQNLLWDEMDKKWPNYTEVNSLYFKPFDKADWKAKKAYRRDYLKANEWLKEAWDFKDKMKKSLAAEVEQLASEMIPPLGPITRDDTDLNSVLVERIMSILGASFAAGEMVEARTPITEGAPPAIAAEVTEGVPVTDQAALAALDVTVDTEAESVVQYEQPKRTTWRRAAAPSRARAPTTSKFSWNYVKSQLGQSAFALIQHWNTKKPLGGELKTSLEEMYRSNPLGFGDFNSWLGFVKSLWRASVVTSRGRGVKGLAKKPRSFWSGQGQPGAGRKFLPW